MVALNGLIQQHLIVHRRYFSYVARHMLVEHSTKIMVPCNAKSPLIMHLAVSLAYRNGQTLLVLIQSAESFHGCRLPIVVHDTLVALHYWKRNPMVQLNMQNATLLETQDKECWYKGVLPNSLRSLWVVRTQNHTQIFCEKHAGISRKHKSMIEDICKLRIHTHCDLMTRRLYAIKPATRGRRDTTQ